MEGICDECGEQFNPDEGTVVDMEFWTWDAQGNESTITRKCILCPACAAIEGDR